MTINIKFKWEETEGRNFEEVQASMGFFSLLVGEKNLTENKNMLMGDIQESALVSAYPLATWFALSWWRLFFEPLPCQGNFPSTSWRMAHELAAANEGFLWPRVIMASDNENMFVWAAPSNSSDKQFLRYINGLEYPAVINLYFFKQKIESFISGVIERLQSKNIQNSHLEELWKEIVAEQNDLEARKYRIREAELGFDPDECDEEIMRKVFSLSKVLGESTFSEIAPIYGREASEGRIAMENIATLIRSVGLQASPDLSKYHPSTHVASLAPWKRAASIARKVRREVDAGNKLLTTDTLCELLGVCTKELDEWVPSGKQKISLAAPGREDRHMSFYLRKRHPIAKRFELARLLGDYLYYRTEDEPYLACTDLSTSRQKFQRAFAAEFLSPLEGLKEKLESDFSESSRESVAEEYQVSIQTVDAMLVNNGLMEPSHLEMSFLPYGESCA